jgi:hypothetical protein
MTEKTAVLDICRYVSHSDILNHSPIKPDFGRVVNHRNLLNSATVRGLSKFVRKFTGGIFSNEERTGQEALDLIVRTGLAEPQDAKNVLHGILTPTMCPAVYPLIYSFVAFQDEVSGETRYKYRSYDW